MTPHWCNEKMWKNLAIELLLALEDIRDHSGVPGFNDAKWSNYVHKIAFESSAKAREQLSMK